MTGIVNDYFFYELGYLDLGSFAASNISDGTGSTYSAGTVSQSLDITAFTLKAGLRHEMHQYMEFFVKAGLYYANVDYSGFLSETSKSSGPVFGMGFYVPFSDKYTAKVEWSFYKNMGGDFPGVFGIVGPSDLDLLSIGIGYSF